VNQIDYDNLIHYRFARRVGELHPDATYGCALEGPRPGRRKLTKAVLIVILVGIAGAIIKVLA
jgi:hypothetical protein